MECPIYRRADKWEAVAYYSHLNLLVFFPQGSKSFHKQKTKSKTYSNTPFIIYKHSFTTLISMEDQWNIRVLFLFQIISLTDMSSNRFFYLISNLITEVL